MSKELGKYIPPIIYCPKCGNKIMLHKLNDSELARIISDGYDEGAKGICKCGVFLLICHLPLPESPSYSIFFDIYKITNDILALLEEKS